MSTERTIASLLERAESFVQAVLLAGVGILLLICIVFPLELFEVSARIQFGILLVGVVSVFLAWYVWPLALGLVIAAATLRFVAALVVPPDHLLWFTMAVVAVLPALIPLTLGGVIHLVNVWSDRQIRSRTRSV